MWNLDFEPPVVIEVQVLARLPSKLRRTVRKDWAKVFAPGRSVSCSLEGAAFDREGGLRVSDAPTGRILRLSRYGKWGVLGNTG